MQTRAFANSDVPESDTFLPDPRADHCHFLHYAQCSKTFFLFFFIPLNIKERVFPYVTRHCDIHHQVAFCLCINLAGAAFECFDLRDVSKRTASLVSPLARDFCLIKKAFPPANVASYNSFVSFQNVPCLAQVVQSRSLGYLSKSPRPLSFSFV